MHICVVVNGTFESLLSVSAYKSTLDYKVKTLIRYMQKNLRNHANFK